MLQAFLLIAFGTISRLIPHFWNHDAWNLVPIGAIALFAGSRLPKRFAWSIPVSAMILSDIVMDQRYGSYFHSPTRWLTYGILALIAIMGVLAKGSKANIFRLAGLSLSGSILFFLTSNFGCWAWSEGGTVYPGSISGLMTCYIAGIPFFKNTVLSELIGTVAFFGLAPLMGHAWHRWVANSPAPNNSADLVVASSASSR